MFRAVYRQIARFLNWVNRTGSRQPSEHGEVSVKLNALTA